jgi:hypothetical protein
MACPHCGSWSVKSDRSLAGRLVCGSCGRPLGVGGGKATQGRQRGASRPRASTGRATASRSFGGRSSRRGRSWWLVITLLLAISAGLASLQAPPRWSPQLPQLPQPLPRGPEA